MSGIAVHGFLCRSYLDGAKCGPVLKDEQRTLAESLWTLPACARKENRAWRPQQSCEDLASDSAVGKSPRGLLQHKEMKNYAKPKFERFLTLCDFPFTLVFDITRTFISRYILG